MLHIGFDAKRYFHNRTGLGNYSRDLVRIVSTRFPGNQFFLFNPKPTTSLPLSGNTIGEVISPNTFLWKKLKSLWRLVGCKADITVHKLHIYHGLSGELPLGMRSTNTKTVVTIHDLIFMRYPSLYPPIDRFIYRWKTKHAVKTADGVVAISEQTKQDLVQYLGTPSEKIKVIYQGCADAFKTPYAKTQLDDTRQKFNLPEQYLLNVGTIEHRKNALAIIKAIKDIDTTLVLVGRKTAYQKEIDTFVVQHHLQHKIIYLQNVSLQELAMIYQMATLFIYPSIFEGFGIPIIEALFSCVPVITTAGGVFPEAGGPHSVYVDTQDAQALAKAINQLLHDPERWQHMATKGLEFAQKFNDDVLAAEIMDYYQQLVNA